MFHFDAIAFPALKKKVNGFVAIDPGMREKTASRISLLEDKAVFEGYG